MECGLKILKFLIALLPSRLKILYYRSRGAKIGKECYIGMSIIDSKDIEIGDCVYIGSFNLIWRLVELKLESGSRIEMGNWITGGRLGGFRLGKNSAIQRFHFMEASSDITIGNNCIIAGRNSHFFSHGISSVDLDVKQPILIGNWVYIGSSCRFAPGTGVNDFTFVGMGAVVTKKHKDNYVLLAGNPAIVKKILSPHDAFFNRQYLPHSHHPAKYKG